MAKKLKKLTPEYVDLKNDNHLYFETEDLQEMIGLPIKHINMLQKMTQKILTTITSHNKEIDKTGPTNKTDKMDIVICKLVEKWNDKIELVYFEFDQKQNKLIA